LIWPRCTRNDSSPYDPYLIYLRVLYERYGDELEEEKEEDGGINLTNFQQDAVRRANRFLDKHGGVIVGDEVGLGKTYIAGELLRQYVQQNRQRALVVAPAYLRDGMWTQKESEWESSTRRCHMQSFGEILNSAVT